MKAVTEFFYFLHQISQSYSFNYFIKEALDFFILHEKSKKKKYFYFLHERSQQSSLYLLHSFKIPEIKEQRQKIVVKSTSGTFKGNLKIKHFMYIKLIIGV